MFISEWKIVRKDVLGDGTPTIRWESTNCIKGPVHIIQIGDLFFGRDENGMLVSQFGDSSFEECVKLMETCFTWLVPMGRSGSSFATPRSWSEVA